MDWSNWLASAGDLASAPAARRARAPDSRARHAAVRARVQRARGERAPSVRLPVVPEVCELPHVNWAFEPTTNAEKVDPFAYDTIIIAFSGGKDSMALLLLLLHLGVPRERIELWHHDVDGREGSKLFDWPCTRSYCAAVARAFGVRIYFSWKVGGLEGELLRENAPTAGYRFEMPDGLQTAGGKSNKLGTRRMFPQQAADLSTRWCSAYGKIMTMEAAIRNQDRFHRRRTLVLTGERAEESPAREHYRVFEPHRTDLRDGENPRWVDVWRPVHGWPEAEVWALIEQYRVNPHPAYRLGWGRVSCAACIFSSHNQWASLRVVHRRQFDDIAAHELSFKKTIDREGLTVIEQADLGTPFPGMREQDIRAAVSATFDEPVFVQPWVLPRGALRGDKCGPT